MSGNIENGREYLLHVMECLKKRLAETDAAILEGEKEIEDMHEYSGKTIQRWMSTVMKTLITSRHFFVR